LIKIIFAVIIAALAAACSEPAGMARIPAGTFIMGSPETEQYRNGQEKKWLSSADRSGMGIRVPWALPEESDRNKYQAVWDRRWDQDGQRDGEI